MKLRFLCGVSLLLAVLPSGCGESSTPPKSLPPAPMPVASGVMTDAECQELADRFDQAIQTGDIAEANSIFAWDLCFDRALYGIDLPQKTRNEILRGMRSSLQNQGLFHEIVNGLNQGGSFKFLRVHEVDGQKRALFRLILPTAGVNYHDYMLTKDETGKVRVYDVFIYLTGEPISETMRRMLLQLAASENRGMLDRLTGREQLLVKHFDKVSQMIASLQQRNPAQALAVYDRLPTELKEQQFILLLGMRAAQESENFPKYQEILETFRRAHPDNPAMNFMSIDYFAMREEYEKSLEAINGLPEAIANDTYVDVMRAGALISAKKFDEAQKAADSAIAKEPDLIDPYWVHVTVSLEQSQFDETLKWLKTIDENFAISWDETLSAPVYQAFRQSPQYREWLAYQGQ